MSREDGGRGRNAPGISSVVSVSHCESGNFLAHVSAMAVSHVTGSRDPANPIAGPSQVEYSGELGCSARWSGSPSSQRHGHFRLPRFQCQMPVKNIQTVLFTATSAQKNAVLPVCPPEPVQLSLTLPDAIQCTFLEPAKHAELNTDFSARLHRCVAKFCRFCLKNRYDLDFAHLVAAVCAALPQQGHIDSAGYIYKCVVYCFASLLPSPCRPGVPSAATFAIVPAAVSQRVFSQWGIFLYSPFLSPH